VGLVGEDQGIEARILIVVVGRLLGVLGDLGTNFLLVFSRRRSHV
jgi:hypothetical protein